ncbi:hypothetical protein NDU88_002841 [Pleurodeles waltl]|uniref:Uncharacterized protein n=1 Tax=Pleurodeles waltl TaxID=8319 RepID=A0AAV7P873_PLEWA|nr:hypothetical protein NDU88_002841 [Pleurodeles waltl]
MAAVDKAPVLQTPMRRLSHAKNLPGDALGCVEIRGLAVAYERLWGAEAQMRPYVCSRCFATVSPTLALVSLLPCSGRRCAG